MSETELYVRFEFILHFSHFNYFFQHFFSSKLLVTTFSALKKTLDSRTTQLDAVNARVADLEDSLKNKVHLFIFIELEQSSKCFTQNNIQFNNFNLHH